MVRIDPKKEAAAEAIGIVREKLMRPGVRPRLSKASLEEGITVWVDQAFTAWPCSAEELARLALENARTEIQLEGFAGRRRRAKPTPDGPTSEQAPRDVPKRGRKPKTPRGIEPVVDPKFRPLGQPRDWVDAAVRVITDAALALLSVGRGGARPGMLQRRIRLLGFEPPEWLSDALLETLVSMMSPESGSGGQLTKRRLEELLRDRPKLRRYLRAGAGKSNVGSLDARVPRKRRPKKRK